MHTTAIVTTHESSNFQKIESFKNIINPLPLREKINANINKHKLIIGFKTRNPQLLEQYIYWAQTQVKHKPRIKIYRDLLIALKTLNKIEQYQQVLLDAQNTYPDISDWSLP